MTPLEKLIRARIGERGPVPVSDYMALALGHPEHGYYMKGDPFGAGGDFITSPEIGQVFGELIGLWSAVVWQQMGSPERIVLIECGPGRGTLMADFLRAAGTLPAFAASIELHLIETSERMRRRQRSALPGADPVWHASLDTVPAGPAILIANEFIDALPIRQTVRTDSGWAERCVGVEDGKLCFVTGAEIPEPDVSPPGRPPPGTIFETCPDALAFLDALAARFSAAPGAALCVDYGYGSPATGDTLQAVRDHAFADPLADPGEADLTAHVDFSALASRATNRGCVVFGPVSQASFLGALGIAERTEALCRNADPKRKKEILSATRRLIDPAAMGTLFKALAIASPGSDVPAGFETAGVAEDIQND